MHIIEVKSNWDIVEVVVQTSLSFSFQHIVTRAKFGKDDTFFDTNLCVPLPIRRNEVGDNII